MGAKVTIEPIQYSEVDEVIQIAYESFKEHLDYIDFKCQVSRNTNWDISVKLVEDGRIIGSYLFGDRAIKAHYTSHDLSNLLGLEGVCLSVVHSRRGLGYGTLLKNYASTLGFDYIWGGHMRVLNNLNHWLNRRELVCEALGNYITLEIFKK